MADDAEYGLLMPFVACLTQGGTYEDRAFVAGYNCGALDARMQHEPEDVWAHYVAPDLIAQLDLIAMRHGWTLTHEPWDEHPDEWTLATFTRADPS